MHNRPTFFGSRGIAPLNVQPYESYLPTAFDESLSILQKLNKMIKKMNELGYITNNIVKQWNELIKWIIDEGLEEIVNIKIQELVDNGTFTKIIGDILGDLSKLKTTYKDDIVGAVNEVWEDAQENKTNIGDLSQLLTTNKDNLVNAINELFHDTELNNELRQAFGEFSGRGVVNGYKVEQQPVLAMAVQIGVGMENIAQNSEGNRWTLDNAGMTLPIGISSPTLNRYDLVAINELGVPVIIAGVSSLNAVKPSIPVNYTPLAYVFIGANDTTVNNVDIEDIRQSKSYLDLPLGAENPIEAIIRLQKFVEIAIQEMFDAINTTIGSLSDLVTDDRTNVVNAINSVFNDLTSLAYEYNQTLVATNQALQNLADTKAEKVDVGNKINLTTSNKENLVLAINELVQTDVDINNKIGDLLNLPTTDKSNIVNAIIEIVNIIDEKVIDVIGDMNLLPTQDKSTIVNAIVEMYNNMASISNVGDLSNLNTINKDTIVNAINEVLQYTIDNKTKIGDMNALATNARDTLVNAINEVHEISEDNARRLNNFFINVKDFGATGDGNTDDTLAIQRAIDSAFLTWSGGTVYFPSGHYLTTAPIDVKTGVKLLGASMRNTRIFSMTPNGPLIRSLEQHRFVIENLMLDGVGRSGKYACAFYNSTDFVVRNVWIDSVQYGIYTNDCYFVHFDTVRMMGTQYGYQMVNASNAITLTNCSSLTTVRAMRWEASSTLQIQGCSFEGNAQLQLVNVQGAVISGSYWEGMHEEPDIHSFIQLGDVFGNAAKGITIQGCFFLIKAKNGIVLHTAEGVEVHGNYFSTSEKAVLWSTYDNVNKHNIHIGANSYDIRHEGYNDMNAIGLEGGSTNDFRSNMNTAQVQPMQWRPFEWPVQNETIALGHAVLYFNGTDFKIKFRSGTTGLVTEKTIAFVEDLPE